MLNRFIRAIAGMLMMPFCIRPFNPQVLFKNKRVAIVGPASSVFDEKNGKYIDTFDYVIRLNKAPHSFNEEQSNFIGSKTDILFHSFYENNHSGGGPLDYSLYHKLGIKWVVNPRYTWDGWRGSFNFYKKYLQRKRVYYLKKSIHEKIAPHYKPWRPTMGAYALSCVLLSEFELCYITGFTFFRTPYTQGYRDTLSDIQKKQAHIKHHGIHNPEIELSIFIKLLKQIDMKKIVMDKQLSAIIEMEMK